MDHDLTDAKKFLRFQPDYYLQVVNDVITPVLWDEPIYHATILNVERIPHFGRSPKVNFVVRLLLTRMHGGYMWMDSKISLDPHLIWRIMKLRKKGKDPTTVFVDKTQDKQLAEKLNKKFGLKKKGHGYDIDSISDEATSFATQLLSTKLLRKGRHNQVTTTFIELGSQCA